MKTSFPLKIRKSSISRLLNEEVFQLGFIAEMSLSFIVLIKSNDTFALSGRENNSFKIISGLVTSWYVFKPGVVTTIVQINVFPVIWLSAINLYGNCFSKNHFFENQHNVFEWRGWETNDWMGNSHGSKMTYYWMLFRDLTNWRSLYHCWEPVDLWSKL